jgi:hypothetical protein
MPRMRMVKPEFWTDSKVVRVSRDARLLFIGLWNFADCDAGHVEADPFALRMKIFPADDVNIEPLLEELIGVGLIEVYDSNVGRFYLIPGLRAHQRTESRWVPRCRVCKAKRSDSLSLSEPRRNSREFSEPLQTSREFTKTRTNSTNLAPVGEGEERRGKDGKGEERRGEVSKGEVSYRTRSSPTDFDRFWEIYPRKVGKPKAKTAFNQAARSTDAEVIIAGALAYRDDPNRQDQYTAHPTTWLHREGWNDDPLPERRPAQQLSFSEERNERANEQFLEYQRKFVDGSETWGRDSTQWQINSSG